MLCLHLIRVIQPHKTRQRSQVVFLVAHRVAKMVKAGGDPGSETSVESR